MIITIDGPAGSGKTTTARYFAKHYTLKKNEECISFSYLNSGVFYRAITLYTLCTIASDDSTKHNEIDVSTISTDRILEYTKRVYTQVVPTLTWISEKCSSPLLVQILAKEQNNYSCEMDIQKYFYSPSINAFVAQISCYKPLRESLTKKMQDILLTGNWIVEGRDAGTHIAPNAELKIYLDVSNSVRAKRRHAQYATITENTAPSEEYVKREILCRDSIDMSKGVYSLRIEKDTHYLHNDLNTIEQNCDTIYNCLLKAIHR